MDENKIRDFLKECKKYSKGAIIEIANTDGQIRFDSNQDFEIDKGVLIAREERYMEYIDCDSIVRLTLEVV
ncbi:MAG: hypothetical protein ACOCRX_08660 [Candidatus Woesearchaeota archaeon]